MQVWPQRSQVGSGSGCGLSMSTKNYTSKLSIDTWFSHDCHRTERHPVEGVAWRQLPTNQSLALRSKFHPTGRLTGNRDSWQFPFWVRRCCSWICNWDEHGVTGNSSWRLGYAKVTTLYQTDPDRPECHEGVPGSAAGCCVNGDAAIGTLIQEKLMWHFRLSTQE